MQDKQIRFQQLVEKLDLLSPLKIMTRGYGIVFKDGDIVKSVDQVKKKERTTSEIRLSDGLVNATVTAAAKNKRFIMAPKMKFEEAVRLQVNRAN